MKKNYLIFIIMLLISGVISCILGCDCIWDLYSYHYYNAFAVLNNKIGYDLMPAGIQSYLNPVLDVIDYLIINTFRYNKELVLFLLGIPYGCFTFLSYLVNKKLFSQISKNDVINKALIIFATVIGASECFIISEVGTAYHDINIGIFILLMLLFVLNYLEKEKIKYLYYAGFFGGMACGFKLVAIPYFFALLLTFVICNIKTGFKSILKNTFIIIIFGFLGFMLIDGYWMYILWQKFHNPVFPMYNSIFKSEWYTYVNYKDLKFADIYMEKILFYPFIWSNIEPNKVAELSFFDFRHSFAYISVLFSSIWLIIQYKKEKFISVCEKKQIFVIIFILLSYLFWVNKFGILRYFIPVLILSGTVITIFISKIKFFINNKNYLIVLLVILLGVSFIKYKTPAWGRSDDLIYPTSLPIRRNSVVFIYGKPIGFLAANNYPKTRFIYLYDDIDGNDKNFTPSKNYYDYVDKIIQNKRKYIIRTKHEYNKNTDFHKYIKNKYIKNHKLKCKKEKLYYWTYVYFCEYLD